METFVVDGSTPDQTLCAGSPLEGTRAIVDRFALLVKSLQDDLLRSIASSSIERVDDGNDEDRHASLVRRLEERVRDQGRGPPRRWLEPAGGWNRAAARQESPRQLQLRQPQEVAKEPLRFASY